MELLEATSDFKINGQSYRGFPLLLYDSMEPCAPANEFLRYYLLRGAIGSRRSWPSTGRALYDYFGFLQAHDLSWKHVHRDQDASLVNAYRDYSLSTIGLDPNTVRQRLIYICAFYEYALRRGWIDALPFDYEDRLVRRNGRFLSHIDASGGRLRVRDVTLKMPQRLVKFLDKAQAKTLLAAATNPHHRMMIRIGIQTGLRREEIATFPVAYVVNPSRLSGLARNVRIRLDPRDGNHMRTKGGKVRDIFVSRHLMRDLHHYVKHVRGERAWMCDKEHPQLFLNHRGEPFAGSGKGIERIVREIGKRAGIQVHPHMLRHTYATHTLVFLRRSGSGVEPLVFVQRQLGHSSLQTTMVYAHLVNDLADQAVLAYDDELNEWTA